MTNDPIETLDLQEAWAVIPGTGGAYEASDLGRIRRVTTHAGRRKSTPKIMSQWVNPGGYMCTTITLDGVSRMRCVNALVCAAFHGPKPNGCQSAHRDGNKINNTPGNLRWDTPKGNAADKRRHGTHLAGESHGRARLTEAQVLTIRSATGKSYAALATQYGVTKSQIAHIINRRTWKHV